VRFLFRLTCHCPGPLSQRVGDQGSTGHKVFLGPRRDQPKIVVTSTFPTMGAALFPPRSPPSLLPLEKVPDVMNFFIMVQSSSLCFIGYG
jgi:hypothetical protein